MAKPRTESELWRALQGLDDDLLDPALPEAAVDAELAAAGLDPAALADGAKRLADDAERLAWQQRAAVRRAELTAKLPVASASTISRAEMLTRLEELRAAAPAREAIRLAARKRKPEESTDDELRLLLDEMEALRALEGDEPT